MTSTSVTIEFDPAALNHLHGSGPCHGWHLVRPTRDGFEHSQQATGIEGRMGNHPSLATGRPAREYRTSSSILMAPAQQARALPAGDEAFLDGHWEPRAIPTHRRWGRCWKAKWRAGGLGRASPRREIATALTRAVLPQRPKRQGPGRRGLPRRGRTTSRLELAGGAL